MTDLSLAVKTQKIKKALADVFSPKMREMGFQGGHGGFRRLTPRGVDVLVIRYDYGSFQLDAGRLPRRKTVDARSISQDWGDYAQAPHPQPGCARKSLYANPHDYCFEYGDIKAPQGYQRMAAAAVRSVQKNGIPFWSKPRRK